MLQFCNIKVIFLAYCIYKKPPFLGILFLFSFIFIFAFARRAAREWLSDCGKYFVCLIIFAFVFAFCFPFCDLWGRFKEGGRAYTRFSAYGFMPGANGVRPLPYPTFWNEVIPSSVITVLTMLNKLPHTSDTITKGTFMLSHSALSPEKNTFPLSTSFNVFPSNNPAKKSIIEYKIP